MTSTPISATTSSMLDTSMLEAANQALPAIGHNITAFSHVPEHGFSIFLANRTKLIHLVRHAEGLHNEVNRAYGDDTPVIYSTPNSWRYQDARLTCDGIDQCIKARETLLSGVNPQLVVVSPFTRTLQTAHIMFGGKGYPFIVHDLCRERSGRYTCDKRRTKTEIVADMKPIYDETDDRVDFDSYGYRTEADEDWQEERESSELVIGRSMAMMKWLAQRPENEITVVTHSSWLKHLFQAFGSHVDDKDKGKLHRLAGNAEVRSITLALHRGFYPEGQWHQQGDQEVFIPHDRTFRRFRWAPTNQAISHLHKQIQPVHQDGDEETPA